MLGSDSKNYDAALTLYQAIKADAPDIFQRPIWSTRIQQLSIKEVPQELYEDYFEALTLESAIKAYMEGLSLDLFPYAMKQKLSEQISQELKAQNNEELSLSETTIHLLADQLKLTNDPNLSKILFELAVHVGLQDEVLLLAIIESKDLERHDELLQKAISDMSHESVLWTLRLYQSHDRFSKVVKYFAPYADLEAVSYTHLTLPTKA